MAIPFRAEAISGSITRTVNGVSYLVAGSNITVVSASNGQITISSTGGGADADWTDNGGELLTTSSVYIGTGSSDELGTDVSFFVSGTATDDFSSTDKSLFAGDVAVSGTLSGFSGFSGSLTRLTDGTSYISTTDETPIINVASSSNGGITLENNLNASVFMRQASDQVPGGYVLTTADGITSTDTFPAGQATRTFSVDGSVARVSGTNFTGNITVEGTGSFQSGLSGSLTRLTDGSSFIEAGTNITVTSASNGAITISSAGGGADADWLDTGGTLSTTSSVYMTDEVFVSGTIHMLTCSIEGGGGIQIGSLVDTNPVGSQWIAIGGKVNNVGDAAVAIGTNTDANASYAVCIGSASLAGGTGAISIGRSAFATTQTIALGYQASTLSSTRGIGIGAGCVITGDRTHAVVSDPAGGTLTGNNGVAMGYAANLDTDDSVVLGREATSSENNQLVIGSSGYPVSNIHIGSGSGSPNNLIDVASGTMALMGYPGADNAPGTDVVLFLSGSPGSRAYGNKGTTAIGGDLVVSGTLYCLTSSNEQPALRITKAAGPGRVSPAIQNGPWMQFDRGKDPGDFTSDLGATFSIGLMSGTTGDVLVIGQGTSPDQTYTSGTAYTVGGAFQNKAYFSGSQPIGKHHFYMPPGGSFSVSSGEFNEFLSIDVGSGSNGHQVDIGGKANTKTTVSTGDGRSQQQTGSFSIVESPTNISSGSQRRVGTSQQTTDASLENALILKPIDDVPGGGDVLMFYKDNAGGVATRKYIFNYEMIGSHVSSVDYKQYASLGTADPFGLYLTGSNGHVNIQVSGSASTQADWRVEATYFGG